MRLVVAILVLAMSTCAFADELAIKPGLWETRTTHTNPMTGKPTTETNQSCVKQTTFDPESMMKDTEGCDVLESKRDGNALNFHMKCGMNGAEANVTGHYETDGDTGSGNMNMEMSMGPMNMTMKMQWDAKRLGDC
ncbi:MAG: DUF3617 family protein [Pseudomonadales bacterium]|nr:DUF3617 family protein [Pseudomonadales bacterium]